MRTAVGFVAVFIAGLLTYEVIALAVSGVALVVACVALVRTERQGDELAAWRAQQEERAAQLPDEIDGG